jgi:hypothetical protein
LGNENAGWKVTQEEDVEVVGPSTAPENTPVVGVVDNAHVEVVHMLSKRTEAETHVSTVVGPPNSEVSLAATTTICMESSTLSFGWAMADLGFAEGADGFCYDREGVRYHRSGEEGQYIYEQVTSVSQGGLDVDRVPSPLADAMVTRVLDYVSVETPPEIQELIEGQLLESDAREEVGTQSS